MTLREHQGWVVNVHNQRGINGKVAVTTRQTLIGRQ
jgi:hypothetical protein